MKLILIGYVNKQNCRIWGTENLSRGTIRPFFFENEQGEAVTVNGDRYRAILNEFLFPKIEEDYTGNIWFQPKRSLSGHVERILVHKN